MTAPKVNAPLSLRELAESVSIHIGQASKYQMFKRMYANDRVAFVHDCIPSLSETITDYQEETLSYFDDKFNRVAIRGPHGLGKTMIASVLVHHSVLTAVEDCKVPTTASAWRQLERYLWPEIHKTAKLLNWNVIGREPYSSEELMVRNIKMDNAEAFAMSSDDETTLEGAHATRIVTIFDEAKTIPAPTWDALEGAFSTEGLSDIHEVLVLAISTPGEPSGRFYDIHMQGPGFDDWKVRHVTIDEAIRGKRISPQWAEQRRKQWGEGSVVYQNRVLGQFADNSEDGVIPMSWINAAVTRYNNWQDRGAQIEDSLSDKSLGVDCARSGRDSTCISVRIGLTLTDLHRYPKTTNTENAGYVNIQSPNCKVITIEGDHLGSAVYDIMREQGKRNLQLLLPGGSTFYTDSSGTLQFLNNRAAMWWNMREMLDPDQGHDTMLPDDPQLIGDLAAPLWKVNSRGVIQLESKQEIKKRIGRSPDTGDSCCLAFWSYRRSRGGGVVF